MRQLKKRILTSLTTGNWLCDLEGNLPSMSLNFLNHKGNIKKKKKKNTHYKFVIKCHIMYVKSVIQLELLFGTVYSIWQIYQTMYK